jgi:hypothetical protein
MSSLIPAFPAWDRLGADGRLFKGDPADVGRAALEQGSGLRVEDAMILFGALITLVGLLSLFGWLRTLQVRPHGLMVFNRVGREAGLSWRDRRLLWQIGRSQALPTPLTLMLCPGTLGRLARDHARRQRRRPGTLALARAASIRRHLFASPA